MELLETMRALSGRVDLIDSHLDRLSRAGAALGFPVDADRVRADVAGALRGRAGLLLVRLTLDRAGRAAVSTIPLDQAPPIRTVAVVGWPAGLDEPSRFKTTDRAAYDAALAQAIDAGADEAVLVDGDGLVVEATRANVWLRFGDELVTPALGRRGLAGVMRARLLATVPGTRTADVKADDLEAADEVLLSNAVRGLFPVTAGTRSAGGA